MTEGNGKLDIEELKQRALKITEALYRTTDILFDGEPLKWSLRQTALEIMNIVSGLEVGQMREAEKLSILCRNLFLKLELASSGTYISKMNFEVLKREYSILQNGIFEQSKFVFLLDTTQYRTNILDNNMSGKIEVSQKEEKREEKETVSDNKKIEHDSDRKAIIVSALEGNGPRSVSEIAKLFNGAIGEKTVQRELNSLVEVGAIKKEGEKRWRRYFL